MSYPQYYFKAYKEYPLSMKTNNENYIHSGKIFLPESGIESLLNDTNSPIYFKLTNLNNKHSTEEATYSVVEFKRSFNKFDRDKSGQLELNEFKQLLIQSGQIDLNESRINQLIKTVDLNQDGKLSFSEFLELYKDYQRCETYCGVWEFSADEGCCYIPDWLMKNLRLLPGEIVHIEHVNNLSKCEYVKYK